MSLSNSGSRTGAESLLQKKKNWLRNKIEEIKASYSDTLGAIHEKLDGIVTEPINAANNLLGRPDNALSLLDIATVGNMLQESNKCLFDILLAVCPSGDDLPSQNGNQHANMAMQLVPIVNHPVASQHRETQIVAVSASQPLSVDYMQLEATSIASGLVQHSNLRYNSESADVPFEPLSLPPTDLHKSYKEGGALESASSQDGPVISTLPEFNHSLSSTPDDGACSTPQKCELGEMEDKCRDESQRNHVSLENSVFEQNSSKQVYNSFSTDEADPNGFRAFVSDIVSPARFSIQPEENMPTIRRLQKELNQFYKDRKNDFTELKFKDIPQPGDCCAALFQSDNSWYRACVASLTSPSTILVEYIDYGNVAEVPWRSAFRLHSLFTDLPWQAMHCSLSGVKPVTPKHGATDGEVEWDAQAIEWFDKFVYGQIYEVVPVKAASEVTSIKVLYVGDVEVTSSSVKLLYVEDVEGERPVIKDVANLMVQSGLADFDNQADDQTPTLKLCEETLNEIRKQNREKSTNGLTTCSRGEITQDDEPRMRESTGQKPPRAEHSVNNNIAVLNLSQAEKMPTSCVSVSNRSRSVSCVPAGMERSARTLRARPHSGASTPESTISADVPQVSLVPGITNNSNVTLSEHQIKNDKEAQHCCRDFSEKKQSDPNSLEPSSQLKDEGNIDEEKRVAEWNPMSEDFNSPRNSYGVDDENACVVIEGYAPEKINVCRHYARGRCWNGDRCPNLHPQRTQNGDLKIEVRTFGASALKNLELMEGAWSIGRLTTVNSNGSFYVHIIKAVTDMQQCAKFLTRISSLPEISPDLTNLMSDMGLHYSQGTRRLKDLIKPVPGEMYVVHVPEEKCFYRGMILDVFVSAAPSTIKVHLVDFGRDVVVLETYLHPMCSAFMHLPKQAVMCSLWDGKLSDYPKLEHIASSQNLSPLAMKVQSRNDKTDGPLNVALYKLDKVHLVDFGRDVVVLETYLHPMCSAFMHLPKQAVMCSLWDGKLSDYPKLEHIASSQNLSPLAMKVQSRNDKTDGPLNVALYKLDKVHLVDFGRDVVVLETYLHPMCSAFMHLPKQAVMCSLWDGKLSDYPKLEHIASSQNLSPLAMKVQSRNDKTDGPLNVALYKLDKVHLVDFGRDVVVLETYLHPMCSAFMHLPKQAVMCSLWDGKLSDYPKLEHIASSQNLSPLAMKVQSRNDKTDGPLNVALYKLDKVSY